MKYLDNEWTDEEAVQELENRDKSISDLTAERDSLTERNTALLQQVEAIKAELQETKKLNFTLASQVSAKEKPDLVGDFFKEVLEL